MSVPSVFGLPHLSEDAVAAFADGVLSPAAAARAARHCRDCRECADAVRGQREAVFLLRSAMAPSLPSGLLDRLSGLAMSTDLPPPTSGLPTALDADGVPVFVAHGASLPQPQPLAAGLPTEDEFGADSPHGRLGFGAYRKTVVPLGLLVSVAAVAVGTLGGQAQTFGNGSTGTANLSGVISSNQTSAGQNGQGGQVSGTGGSSPSRVGLRPVGGVMGTTAAAHAPQWVGPTPAHVSAAGSGRSAGQP